MVEKAIKEIAAGPAGIRILGLILDLVKDETDRIDRLIVIWFNDDRILLRFDDIPVKAIRQKPAIQHQFTKFGSKIYGNIPEFLIGIDAISYAFDVIDRLIDLV